MRKIFLALLFLLPLQAADTNGLYWGNPTPMHGMHWPPGSPLIGTFDLDASTDKIGVCDQMQVAGSLTHVLFNYNLRTGTPPVYKAGLQGRGVDGRPDGTYLGGGTPASATFTPPADATWDGTVREILLDNAYTTTRGQWLCMVVEYSSGTVDISNFSQLGVIFFSSSSNSLLGVPSLYTNTGTWAANTNYPIYGFKIGSLYYGYPLKAVGQVAFDSDTTPDEIGIKFTLDASYGSTFKVMGAMWLGSSPASDVDDFKLTQYEGTTQNAQGLMDDTDYFTTVAVTRRSTRMFFQDTTLPTLNFGTAYRVVLGAAGTYTADPNLWYFDVENSAHWSAFPGGTQFSWTQRTDAGSWTDTATRRPLMDIIISDVTEPTGGGGGGSFVFIQ